MRSKSVVRLGMGMVLLVFGLDQATKWWILESVMQPPRVLPLTPFFNLVMGWNRGVSFGMFNQDSPYNVWIFTGLALVIAAVLVVWMWRAESRLVGLAIGLIVGGALGNAVDRMRFGAVFDFLDVHVAGYHWPAFNVADSGITIGAALLLADALFSRPEKPKNKASNQASET
ncbi:MAG: signal peptidase II [Rhodospirillales bacterium]|nr:signal peptidase II [Rhodospirillales bacterium]